MLEVTATVVTGTLSRIQSPTPGSRLSHDTPLVDGIPIERRDSGGNRVSPSDPNLPGFFSGFRRIFFLLFIFAAAVAVGAMIAIVTGRRRERRPEDAPPPLTASRRFQEMKSALIKNGILVEEDLSNLTSSQSRALDWLVNQDGMQLGMQEDDTDALIQRYVLAIFYYSVGGEGWADHNLSAKAVKSVMQVCDVYRITCWNDPELTWTHSADFMSTSSHECDWFGVACYEGTLTVGSISMSEYTSQDFGCMLFRFLSRNFCLLSHQICLQFPRL